MVYYNRYNSYNIHISTYNPSNFRIPCSCFCMLRNCFVVNFFSLIFCFSLLVDLHYHFLQMVRVWLDLVNLLILISFLFGLEIISERSVLLLCKVSCFLLLPRVRLRHLFQLHHLMKVHHQSYHSN